MKVRIHSTLNLSHSPLFHRADSSPRCCRDPYRPYCFERGGVKKCSTNLLVPTSAVVYLFLIMNPARTTNPVHPMNPSLIIKYMRSIISMKSPCFRGIGLDKATMPAPSNPAKAHKSKNNKRATKSKRKPPPKLSANDYACLQKASVEKKKQYGKSENMNSNYGGQVKCGQEFVARFSVEQAEAERRWQEDGDDILSGDDDEDEIREDGPAKLDPNFHKAFDGPPIECTLLAISMFMTHKCFTENRKASTAISIHATFTWYYDQMYVSHQERDSHILMMMKGKRHVSRTLALQ